jgi:hypothetical protein
MFLISRRSVILISSICISILSTCAKCK